MATLHGCNTGPPAVCHAASPLSYAALSIIQYALLTFCIAHSAFLNALMSINCRTLPPPQRARPECPDALPRTSRVRWDIVLGCLLLTLQYRLPPYSDGCTSPVLTEGSNRVELELVSFGTAQNTGPSYQALSQGHLTGLASCSLMRS